MNGAAYNLWAKAKESKDRLVPLGDAVMERAFFELVHAGFLSERSYIDSKRILHCVIESKGCKSD